MSYSVNGTIIVKRPVVHLAESLQNRPAGEKKTRFGNELPFRRMSVLYQSSVVQVPIVSGNAIRGTLRRLGAKHLLNMLEIKEQDLDKKLFYLLMSGGALDPKHGESVAPKKATVIRKTLRQNIPLLSIFGCSYGYDIMSGKVKVDFAIPKILQTKEFLQHESTIDVSEVTDWTHYTRLDDYEYEIEVVEEETLDSNPHQMIIRLEYMVPGTELSHKYSFDPTTTSLEYSCFGTLIREFMMSPYIGGKSNTGHGEVEFRDYAFDNRFNPTEYETFLKNHRDEIVDYLMRFQHGQPPLVG